MIKQVNFDYEDTTLELIFQDLNVSIPKGIIECLSKEGLCIELDDYTTEYFNNLPYINKYAKAQAKVFLSPSQKNGIYKIHQLKVDVQPTKDRLLTRVLNNIGDWWMDLNIEQTIRDLVKYIEQALISSGLIKEVG